MTNLPLNINITQIMLHLLNFLILFAVLYFLLYKPVKNFMEKRDNEYREMDEKARENLAATESVRQDYEQKIYNFEQEVTEIREKARKDTERINAKRIQDAHETAAKIISDAKKEALREKQKIIAEAQADISDMVTDAIEKLALENTTSEAYDQFLDAVEFLDERGSKHEQ